MLMKMQDGEEKQSTKQETALMKSKGTCASGQTWPTTNPCEPPENLPSVNNATSCNIH